MLMSAAKRRKTDYLFLRPGSRNWHIRLQTPGKRTEYSLRTPDRVQAELLALPLIAEHKGALLAARPRVETTWHHKLAPGLHVSPDGGHIAASERELTYYDSAGASCGLSRTACNQFSLSAAR
jgi:hypothetical protein